MYLCSFIKMCLCPAIYGIPIVLLIVDKFLCSNLLSCRMSICECLANYICFWCCLSGEKPPIEFEDMEEQENLESAKKKQTAKVAPEGK